MLSPLALSLLLAAPPAVGDNAADFTLESIDSQEVTLSKLTSDGPVVLVVLRGFPGYQCPLCSRQAGEFIGRAEEFAAANASLVFVYPADQTLGLEGTRTKAQEFLSGQTLPENVSLVLDPGYTFTNAYELRWDAPRETAYPSTFVIGTDGVVKAATVSSGHAGRTSAADVLNIVKSL